MSTAEMKSLTLVGNHFNSLLATRQALLIIRSTSSSFPRGAQTAAIGIVLSGSDSDGALGVRAIKHGGIDRAGAGLDQFRNASSAIDSSCVDFVLRRGLE
jgi:hypothetical protein